MATSGDKAVWKKEYISGFGQVLAERSQASNVMTLMSGARATGATVVPFSVGTGLPAGTTLTVDIRTDAGPWAHLTGVTVNAQGQFSIADSNFAAGESHFVRVKREDQPDAAYSQPIALVVDPSVASSSASTINHISISRLGTDLKLRWSLAASNNKPFKILFRRADNNTELDLTPMGLPATSRELSLGSQSQNLPAGNFLAHQVLGTADQGGIGGYFEDGTIPPPASTGPVYITQYHHRDHLGTLRLITDEMGGKLEAHDYEPFGVELNPPFGAASRKKYTGHERDESTGLDYMLARYHSPALGRFLIADPGFDVAYDDPQRWNLYSYSRNSPVCLVDPTGQGIMDSISNGYRAAAGAIIDVGSEVQEFGASLNGGGVIGIAADATLGTVGSMVQGAGDMLNLGTSVGEVAGAGGPGEDFLRAGAAESGRVGGIILTVVSVAGGARASSTTLTDTRIPTADGTVTVPRGSVRSMAENGEGVVYRPAGSTGNANAVRAAGPNARNPDGYARVYNGNAQPVNVATGKPGPPSQTHPALTGPTTTQPPRTVPVTKPPEAQR